MTEPMRVEVAYAVPDQQWLIAVDVATGTTVIGALKASGLIEQAALMPPFDVGIHGRRVALDTLLQAGDRVEVYRDLSFDPMDSRRRRAAKFQGKR